MFIANNLKNNKIHLKKMKNLKVLNNIILMESNSSLRNLDSTITKISRDNNSRVIIKRLSRILWRIQKPKVNYKNGLIKEEKISLQRKTFRKR